MIKIIICSVIFNFTILSASSVFLDVEGLYLERGGSLRKVLVNQGSNKPYKSIITSKKLVHTLGLKPALRVTVGGAGKTQGAMFRGLVSETWNGHKRALGSNLNFPFTNPSYAFGYTGAFKSKVFYKTNLTMLEGYYIREMSQLWNQAFGMRFFAGLQYLNIPEQVKANFYQLVNPIIFPSFIQKNTYKAEVNNHVGCAGMGFLLHMRPQKNFAFEITALGGAGACGIESRTRLGILDNTFTLRKSHQFTTCAAYTFLGTIRAVYQPFSWLELGIGYEAIYAGGLAVAYRQMSYQSLPTSDNRINHEASIWYQGASLRLGLRI